MRWYVSRDGGAAGPLAEAEILDGIAKGSLGPHDWIAPEGARAWQALAEHPPFAAALSAAALRRGVTLVMGPVGAPPSADSLTGTDFSVAEGKPIAAVPVLRARRSVWRILGGLVLLIALGLAGGAAVYLYSERPPEPLPLAVESAVVEVLPSAEARAAATEGDPLAALEVEDDDEEIVRAVIVTAPGASVRIEDGAPVVADASGRATVLHAFGGATDETIDVEAHATLEGDPPREAHRTLRVARAPRLLLFDRTLRCSTRPCGLVRRADGDLVAFGLEGTTRLTIGASTGIGRAPDPSDDVLRALSPDALFGDAPYSIALPVRFETADGARFEGTYALPEDTIRGLVLARFRAITEGPVALPEEGTGRAILWLGGNGSEAEADRVELLSSAPRAGDIGRVATVTVVPQRRRCGQYSGPSGARTLYVARRHADVRVHDRRTGRVLAERRISAPVVACPANVTVEPGGTGDIDGPHSDAPSDAIEAWLRRQ